MEKNAEGKIKEKIKKLQQELQNHQMRLNNAQQAVNIETRNIIAKSGAINALEELNEIPIEDSKKPKDKKA